MTPRDDLTADSFDYAPQPKRRGRFSLVLQRDESDCAAACLAMVCRHYGVAMSIRQLRHAIGVGPGGASMLDIAKAAERLGLTTRGVRLDSDDLLEARLPAITTQGHHFVVVHDVTAAQLSVADPKNGLVELDRARFFENGPKVCLLFNTTPAFSAPSPSREPAFAGAALLSPYRADLFKILSATVALNALGLAVPLLMQVVIDRVLGRGDRDLFALMTWSVVGVSLSTVVAGALRRHSSIVLAQKLEVNLGARFVGHLLSLSTKFFQSHRTGDALQRLHDVDRLKAFVSAQGVETLVNLVMLSCFGVVIAVYGFGWAASFLLLAAVAFFVARFTGRRINRELSGVLRHSATASTTLVEAIGNIRTVKSHLAENIIRQRWQSDVRAASTHQFAMGKVSNAFGVLLDFLFKGLPLVILLIGARGVLAGSSSIGQVVALMSLFTLALEPMLNLSNGIVELQQVLLGLDRLSEVFDLEPEVLETQSATALIEGAVCFQDVGFRYGNETSPLVLSNVNFDVKPGQRVALIGPSGSGKSTLVQLLIRLFEPSSGRLLLDGRDLAHYPLAELRRSIGFVNQEAQLFSGSLLENIAFGDLTPDLGKATAAAELADADTFIRRLPAGYEHLLSEDGVGLSAGQRQRVALARALYRNPRILVLDEVTSFLDADSEAAVEAALPRICEGRTVFVITHRIRSIVDCDQIVVMTSGTVAECGSHSELMSRDGLYARWQRGTAHLLDADSAGDGPART